jgi:hypothetical protein
MHPHQLRTIAAAALTVFAMVVFAAPAPAEQDLRSPDARDAAAQATAGQDLRSPDARDAADPRGESVYVRPAQDLRSPDTRDAALISQGLIEQPTSTISVDRAPGPAAAPLPTNGFDLIDALIGAAGALGVALLATGAALAGRRRMHREEPVAVS